MTALADAPGPPPERGALLLWGSAALAALAVHAGLAAWALHHRPEPLAADPAAAAVMIELAAAPVAPPAPERDLAPDTLEAPEVDAPPPPEPPPPDSAPAPTDPVIPEPVAAIQPEATPSPPVVAPPVIEVPPAPTPEPDLAIARPMPRPERPEPPPPKLTETERKPKVAPAKPSQASRKTSVAAPPAPEVAASTTSSGQGASVSPAKWQSQLMAHLERRKRYPSAARARRAEGVVQVRFLIDASGSVLSAQLVRSSGHADLDAEVLALVRRASPVPAPPPGAPRDIVAPVQFNVR